MYLTETHIISRNHKLWKECDRLCFLSKNLYNQALYRINKHFEETGKYKQYADLARELAKEKQIDFIALAANTSQQTLMMLDKNFKSYFQSLKSYRVTPSAFKAIPQKPQFKHKTKGRFLTVFALQCVSKKSLKKGLIEATKSSISLPTNLAHSQINNVRVVPMKSMRYKIEVIYEKEDLDLIDNSNYAGIDIGLNNLAAVVLNNSNDPFIIDGRPLKSINQYYNKQLASAKSDLPHFVDKNGIKRQRSSSKKTDQITYKRNQKINDYMHKASRLLTDRLKAANISKVVIGKNDEWKQGINIGSRNNQQFVSIPHARFIEMLTYKLRLEGIDCICREESYTSKCSFLDNEPISKQESYAGRRIKRGLFKTSTGIVWNADCNGAANILKKEIPNAFANGIEGVAVSPVRVTPNK